MNVAGVMKYVPFAYDAGFILVHAAGVAVIMEKESKENKPDAPKTGPAKKAEAVKRIREQLLKAGGVDLPTSMNNDFTVGLAIDVAVILLNFIGLSRFFNSPKSGSDK